VKRRTLMNVPVPIGIVIAALAINEFVFVVPKLEAGLKEPDTL